MTRSLNVIAVANSDAVEKSLQMQLAGLSFVHCIGVVRELAQAHILCSKEPVDVILVDLTERELDGGLFIQAMSMDEQQPYVLFALHQELNHQIILETVRQGAKEFIHYPSEPNALSEALKRMYGFIQRVSSSASTESGSAQSEAKAGCKIISVFSPKGGSGSSSVAVNLAHELQQLSKEPTLLFDMDQVFNNTAVMLNLKASHALGDLTRSSLEDLDDSIYEKILVEHESGLKLLVGSKSVLDDNDMISPDLLSKSLDYIQRHFSYVVVDLPTHVLDPYHQFFVERSDEVLVVSSLDIPGLYRTRQYLDLATQFLDESKLKLILNRWNLQAAYGMTNKSLEEEFRFPIFSRLNNDWEVNVEANSLGKVYSKVNAKSDLTLSIQKLAKQLMGHVEEEVSNATDLKAKGSFLSNLFGAKKEQSNVPS